MSRCSVCRGEFDLDKEGGTEGEIGILPAAFCPTCYAGVFDMVQQNCWRCIEESEEEEMQHPIEEELLNAATVQRTLEKKEDTGDSLTISLDRALAGALDSYDFEKALFHLDFEKLIPYLVYWRRAYMDEVIRYLELQGRGEKLPDLDVYYIKQRVREIKGWTTTEEDEKQ